MLKATSKVYVVSEFGGEYEDRWEHAIGACSTLELARELQETSRKKHALNPPIPFDVYDELLDKLAIHEMENSLDFGEDYIEELSKMFPKYSKEDLELTDKLWLSIDDYIDTRITEIDYYD